MIRFAQRLRRLAVLGMLPAAAMLAAGPASAQAQFPSKPIELVVPFQPGGGTDALARAFADATRKHMPQSMIIVNKPGASGAIGWQDVINAKPDGYRLAVVTVEVTTLPHMGLAKFTYDDMTPIARLNADQAAITVRADAPWNTIEEFLAAAKKDSGKLSMGNAGNGSIWHLAAAALEDKTSVKFNHTPFQGAGPAVLALLGGHIDAVAVSPAEVTTYVQAGKLKTLAVMADQRVKGFDKVPTLKERGIDLTIGTWRGIAAPKNLPREIEARLQAAVEKAYRSKEYQDLMTQRGFGLQWMGPAEFGAFMAKEEGKFGTVMKAVGLAK